MKAMRAAASGGMMRGPRGGLYRMVNGKKVYGNAPSLGGVQPSRKMHAPRPEHGEAIKGHHLVENRSGWEARGHLKEAQKHPVGSYEHHDAMASHHNAMAAALERRLGKLPSNQPRARDSAGAKEALEHHDREEKKHLDILAKMKRR